MKNIILFLLSAIPLLANNVNPTAPIEALKHWHNDFTDTDGDGMTDVAELKYGFNPNDASSFPSKDYTLLDDAPEEDYPQHESNGIFDPNNEWVFVFHPSDYTKWFTEENKAIYTAEEALELDREFVNLMTPLWFKEVGLPEEALQVINWRVTGVSGQMASTNYLSFSINSNMQVKFHEIFHTSRSFNWGIGLSLSFEEGWATAVGAYMTNLFIEAYPTHPYSVKIAQEQTNQGLWRGNVYDWDLNHGDIFLSGGQVYWWSQGLNRLSEYMYENPSGLASIIINSKEGNLRKYTDIYRSTKFKGASHIHEVYAEVFPELNGIPYKEFVDRARFWDNKKYEIGKLFISIIDSKFFINVFGRTDLVPDYVPPYVGNSSYVRDWSNVKFRVKVENLNKDVVLNKEYITTDRALGETRLADIEPHRIPVGLYKATVNVPELEKYTDDAKSTHYIFGRKHYNFSKTETSILIGADVPNVQKVQIQLNGDWYETDWVNGLAIIQPKDVEVNYRGEAIIRMISNNKINEYKRTLFHTGFRTGERISQFLIVDRDFDGIEDPYDKQVTPLDYGPFVDFSKISEYEHDWANPTTIKLKNEINDPTKPAPAPPPVDHPLPEDPISENEKRIQELELQVTSLLSKNESLQNEKSNLVNENQNLSTTINTHSQTINSLNADILLLNQSVVEWQNKHSTEVAKNKQLTNRISVLENENYILVDTQNQYVTEINSLNEQIEQFKIELENNNQNSPYTHGWFFDPEYGWLFTDTNIFPYFYHSKTNDWLYFSENIDGTRLFYSFNDEQWVEWK